MSVFSREFSLKQIRQWLNSWEGQLGQNLLPLLCRLQGNLSHPIFVKICLGSVLASFFFGILLLLWPIESLELTALPQVTQRPFRLPEKAYQEVGIGGFIADQNSWVELPDLRQEILFAGLNDRPDLPEGKKRYLLSLTSEKEPFSLGVGQRAYLKLESNGRCFFSKEPTSLYLTLEPKGEGLMAHLRQEEKGQVIATPADLADFMLERAKGGANPLLSPSFASPAEADEALSALSTKGHWYGQDLFLERFGGDLGKELAAKQRIEVAGREGSYALYVEPGDCLVWDGKVWQIQQPGPQTVGKILAQVAQVSDRQMEFYAWDSCGQSRISFIIPRSEPPLEKKGIDFRLVGVRSKTQAIVQVNAQRLLLKPNDWFIHTERGWRKISTLSDVDHLLDGKLRGDLFIFGGMEKKEGQWVGSGVLFNSARTVETKVELVEGKGAATFASFSGISRPSPSPRSSANPSSLPPLPRVRPNNQSLQKNKDARPATEKTEVKVPAHLRHELPSVIRGANL